MDEQQTLLGIVQAWNISPLPEHRGFRCAACQSYMGQAWHHWLHTGSYITPVHFCGQCEQDFRQGKVAAGNAVPVDTAKFMRYSDATQTKLKSIASVWNIRAKPVLKPFTCDDCGKPFTEMHHIWYNNAGTMVEVHLCKGCAKEIGIK